MSASHHGQPERDPKENENIKKFLDQMEKRLTAREYPQGRISAEDDGAVAFAIAADPAKKVIVIDFGKPVEWVGLSVDDANQLINLLRRKITELGGVLTITM